MLLIESFCPMNVLNIVNRVILLYPYSLNEESVIWTTYYNGSLYFLCS